jgi:hypothetical protein
MSPVPACTLVSNNYLALARVLAESYREQHPGARVITCIVDTPDPSVRYADLPFETIFVSDLGLANFANLAFRYNVLELNTAVKPFLLEALRLRLGLERIFYLDPDILVLAPLTGLEQALERGSAALTPHVTAPLDDDRVPSERTILMCGVYNLGFLGLRLDSSTAGFLRWWQERLTRFCVHDVDHGLFVDQSWMDLAPAFLPDVQVVRDPVYNVAYWNLAHRFPRRENGRWTIEGQPLSFFHFSGLPFDQLARVSRYQDRIDLRQRPELLPLFEDYRARVMAAGHEAYRTLSYGYGRWADGTRIPDVARRALQRIDPQGARWPDPFAVGPGSWLEWLRTPIAYRGGRLNRLLLSLWDERDDLAQRFPDVLGGDLASFVQHVRNDAERLGLAPEWVTDVGGSIEPSVTGSTRVTLPQPATSAGHLLRREILANPGTFAAWLNEPLGDLRARPRLTRMALMVHGLRSDVQRRFPAPLDHDRLGFAYWLVTDGAREHSIDAALLHPIQASLPARSRFALALRRVKRRVSKARVPAPAPEPSNAVVSAARTTPRPEAELGVNLVGHLARPGTARGSQLALEQAGIAWVPISLDRDPLLDLVRGRQHAPSGAPHALTLLHAAPDELVEALQHVPTATHATGYNIGYWFWHLSHFPLALADAFGFVDEVWAPSRFSLDALRPLARVPLRLVPPCVPQPGTTTASRADLGWDPTRFVFFSSLRASSASDMEAAESLFAALAQTQRLTAHPVLLALRIRSRSDASAAVHKLRLLAGDLPVQIDSVAEDERNLDAPLAHCDAYVSLHRACALGRTSIQALMLARPLIATAYGGVTDFLNESTGWPVPYRSTVIRHALPRCPSGAIWAKADIAAAAAAMADVIARPGEAAVRARAGQQEVRGTYGVDAASARLRAELERLLREGPRW